MQSSSDLEAIQQQLAAMRSTVAASAAAQNGKPAAMPSQLYPPYSSSMAPKGMLDSTDIDREVSDILAQGNTGGVAPPKMDHSEGLISPAAAKHLARYREQVRNVEPPLPSASYGGAKGAAPFQYSADRTGWGGFGPSGAAGTGLDGGAASTRTSTTVGSIGSIGSSIATGGAGLAQRPAYMRPRSVVRSLEPTLSGAASQSSHRL
ncbi:hypothetical protein DUNSADRAFT_2857 [Dunaliella salina]|uniref:Uncharacterized protein n=1 Tax=Dunaliella salina TaxID=3046 RepID=A0ABQ7GV19_DUNSA|nr:hypothetical protein DUNSADRAFT_2857 [Dunaliella salina]|eukprot:KAF5838463.1 hypothetical protein DUNSADRAFT_2857 [Dunaliella salina]